MVALAKKSHPPILGYGLVVSFDRYNFSVSVSYQKIGLIPPWWMTEQANKLGDGEVHKDKDKLVAEPAYVRKQTCKLMTRPMTKQMSQ